MALLRIRTEAAEVYIKGEFCDWKNEGAIHGKREKGHRYINIKDMPEGNYRVFNGPRCGWGENEIYPDDGTCVVNRRFAGDTPEVIRCYFGEN